MIPLFDDNPTRRVPIVTYSLIAACIGIFLWQQFVLVNEQDINRLVCRLGFIPIAFFTSAPVSIRDCPFPRSFPDELTIITSMFLHGGWLHIAGNMLYLWIFGNNVEDSMGRFRFIVFYLLTGVAAALTQGFVEPGSQIPMIGASGAISGVLGGYILLHPRATVFTLVPLGVVLTTIRLPAVIVLGLYIVLQAVQAAITPIGEPGVAWWAHIGGFVAGLALIPFFKSSDVRLFAPPVDRNAAFKVESPRRKSPWS